MWDYLLYLLQDSEAAAWMFAAWAIVLGMMLAIPMAARIRRSDAVASAEPGMPSRRFRLAAWVAISAILISILSNLGYVLAFGIAVLFEFPGSPSETLFLLLMNSSGFLVGLPIGAWLYRRIRWDRFSEWAGFRLSAGARLVVAVYCGIAATSLMLAILTFPGWGAALVRGTAIAEVGGATASMIQMRLQYPSLLLWTLVASYALGMPAAIEGGARLRRLGQVLCRAFVAAGLATGASTLLLWIAANAYEQVFSTDDGSELLLLVDWIENGIVFEIVLVGTSIVFGAYVLRVLHGGRSSSAIRPARPGLVAFLALMIATLTLRGPLERLAAIVVKIAEPAMGEPTLMDIFEGLASLAITEAATLVLPVIALVVLARRSV